MPQDASIDIDTSEFDQALKEYARESDKDDTEILNRTTRNLAFRTAKELAKADRTTIRSVQWAQWPRWPKIIAKILSAGGPYDQEEAQALSKRLLSARSSSVGFMRSGFAKAAKQFSAMGGGLRGSGTAAQPRLTRSKGRALKAGRGLPVAEFIVTYLVKRGRQDAFNKEQMANTALKRALKWVAADMLKYARKKRKKRAEQHSAK